MEHLEEIKKILENFNDFYWNSEMVNNISLIDDLRLSRNIHETAHSRILYKFLLAHTQDEPFLFLKYFLKCVGLGDLFDLKKVKVKVEYENIDVLITDGEKCIIIENKVNHACDQDRQLSRYINQSKEYGNEIYVLYIVRCENDNGPSENSLPAVRKKVMEKNGRFFKISYQKHILEWLNRCKSKLEKCSGQLSSALIQYSNYLEMLLTNKETMNKKDATDFETYFLENKNRQAPLMLSKEIANLREKIQKFINVVADYEKFLEESYLAYFIKCTGISKAILNSSRQIEFAVSVADIEVLFIYDIFRTKPASYVWFGTKYPIDVCGDSQKTSLTFEKKQEVQEQLLKMPDGYTLCESDEWSICERNNFHFFYKCGGWFWKYCKDNEAAIHDIKEYIKWISKA